MLEQQIRKGQFIDDKIREIVKNIPKGKAPGFRLDDKGTLWFGKRLCVPEDKAIREAILREAHESAYSIHPGSTKREDGVRGVRRSGGRRVSCKREHPDSWRERRS
jgi:hypothetical protein